MSFTNAAAKVHVTEQEKISQEMARVLRNALNATKKSVVVKFGTETLKKLKAEKYCLCFAKRIGEEAFNVVWQSYDDYMVTNTFSWTPEYEIFGNNTFDSSLTVNACTNIMPIGIGEICELDAAGVISDTSSGGDSNSLNRINNFGSIHPGVNQCAYSIKGAKISQPIYVSQLAAEMGDITLTPKDEVLVWLEQKITTGTMFTKARTRSIELNMAEASNISITYENGVWLKK